MKLYQIKRRLEIAINTLRVNDNYLLKIDANERSITHKLAIYMEQTFGKNYDVDCEYNRNIGDVKRIEMIESKLYGLSNYEVINQDKIFKDELVERSVFPDIIVHKRGSLKNNLLIIEVKKSTSSVSENYDIEKLKCYTDPNNNLNYKYGVFIKFHTSRLKYELPDIRWFNEGIEMPHK